MTVKECLQKALSEKSYDYIMIIDGDDVAYSGDMASIKVQLTTPASMRPIVYESEVETCKEAKSTFFVFTAMNFAESKIKDEQRNILEERDALEREMKLLERNRISARPNCCVCEYNYQVCAQGSGKCKGFSWRGLEAAIEDYRLYRLHQLYDRSDLQCFEQMIKWCLCRDEARINRLIKYLRGEKSLFENQNQYEKAKMEILCRYDDAKSWKR